jgi:hypothetical protein
VLAGERSFNDLSQIALVKCGGILLGEINGQIQSGPSSE